MKLLCFSFAIIVAATAVNAFVPPPDDVRYSEIHHIGPPPFFGPPPFVSEKNEPFDGTWHPHRPTGIRHKPNSTEHENEKEKEKLEHHGGHEEPSKAESKPHEEEKEEEEGEETENGLSHAESPEFVSKSLSRNFKCKGYKVCCKIGKKKCCKKYKKKCCKKGKKGKYCKRPLEEDRYPDDKQKDPHRDPHKTEPKDPEGDQYPDDREDPEGRDDGDDTADGDEDDEE